MVSGELQRKFRYAPQRSKSITPDGEGSHRRIHALQVERGSHSGRTSCGEASLEMNGHFSPFASVLPVSSVWRVLALWTAVSSVTRSD